MDNPVSIRLLGNPAIEVGLQDRTFPSRGFCLIALLALTPGRTITRAQAASQLWDNHDTHVNMGNMRQLILRMSKALPSLSSILFVDDKTFKITDPSRIDVCRFLEFDARAGENSLRQLMETYRGDLLQGIEVPTIEDPFAVSRTYLRERYFGFAHSALKELTRYGRADVSLIQSLERHVLGIDSSREETYKSLIAAYGALGRADESRRVFALLTDVLRLDGTSGPRPDTRALLVRATTRSIDLGPAPADPGTLAAPHRPRVALLAPNWVSPSREENLQRAFVEDAANELARHKSLVTLASHSSFQASSDGGVLDANSALRADYAVSTFVRPGRRGNELTVRLVQSSSGAIIWAGDYPLSPELIVSSNRALVGRVASELSSAIERHSLASPDRTSDPSAYFSFLKGQDTLKTCDLRSVRRARRCYAQAIIQDGRFADAYSGASSSLYMEWVLLGGNDPALLAEARDLAEQAIVSDPSNSAGYWRRAMVALYQHDFDECHESFMLARERHPNSADILLDYADALGFVGDPDEAWGTFEQAIDLNPTPPDQYWWVGASVAFSQADYRKAIELCGRLRNEEPALRVLTASHGQLGNRWEATGYAHRLQEIYPGETAESMTRLQPHRSPVDRQRFIDGLRIAGIK
ncbi:DNA-binding SARP family transcriptional activator [Rhizobium azibense]|uniref:DNA-binding SARP family transcriptional activator n=1 Tax=Rhizobium azibense TaxID=1136135 RepID=A0A4R3RI01_9HYPH|nr:DNA-binding SARP family transcriptional activator [Rhizobium azibense]